MTRVETIGRIRRAHFVQSLSIREIARCFRMSRKTVRKVIEAPEGAFTYERGKFSANPANVRFLFRHQRQLLAQGRPVARVRPQGRA